jgi:O-methyltransferase
MSSPLDAHATSLYLELLKRSVLGLTHLENEFRIAYLRECSERGERYDHAVLHDVGRKRPEQLAALRRAVENGTPYQGRIENLGFGPSMIGRARLDNVEACVTRALVDGVPGDFIECGVWRGGTTIFVRGLFAVRGILDRRVWVADSFRGLPAPSRPEDAGLDLSAQRYRGLAVGTDAVRAAFEAHGLLDDRVCFLEGWFKDTLVHAPIERLAVLRLDGDLYESTSDALRALYDKVSPGGFVIVDDYVLPPCAQAVDQFRAARRIDEPLKRVDWAAVFWRKRR